MNTLAAPQGESEVGTRLMEILNERKLSLSDLSRGSGVSTSTLSLLTRGIIQYPRQPTLRKIVAALGVEERVLTGPAVLRGTEGTDDLHAYDGTRAVPVVRVGGDGSLVETGETLGIAASMLTGRERLLAALIEGGGCGPHVLVGDRVVFDPDAIPRHNQMVLVNYHGATVAAFYQVGARGASYRFSDGSRLQTERVVVAGVIVYIMRPAPEFPT